jgi:hypothetical protein
MLADPELAKLVPRRLRAEILERRRIEEERRRRAREAREVAERRAREWAERQEHDRVLKNAYWRVRYVYLSQFTLKRADGTWDWVGDAETFDRDWPRDMPVGWLPPPTVYTTMKAFQQRDIPGNLTLEEPDLRPLLPPYVPNAAWPWRRPEAEDDVDGAPA